MVSKGVRSGAFVALAVAMAACHSDANGAAPRGKVAFPDATLAYIVPGGPSSDHLFMAGADGSNVRQLEDGPGCKQDPEWSPDGTRIAFRFMPRCDYTSNRIQILHIPTGDIEDLTSVSGIDGNSPSWSPDGTHIAFSGQTSPTSDQGIFVMRADGRAARRLTPASMEAQYPAWSPDGSRIAFHVASGGSGFDVYVMDADGSNITPIVTGPTQDEWPMWSPDGRQLAFGREGSVSQIVMVDPDGTNERVVTDRGGVPASWAPGGWIVLNCPAGRDRIALCIVRPDGTGFAHLPLGSPETGAGFGAWRP